MKTRPTLGCGLKSTLQTVSIDYQRSTLTSYLFLLPPENYQLSTLNYQLSTLNRSRAGTLALQLSTIKDRLPFKS
ncbi:MAG: hypothetical protein ACRC62_13945 [Microcoleus sp.]